MKRAVNPANDRPTQERRKLLGVAGTTGVLAAAATVLATRERPAEGGDAAPVVPDGDSGYRVTAHVLRYYQTTKV